MENSNLFSLFHVLTERQPLFLWFQEIKQKYLSRTCIKKLQNQSKILMKKIYSQFKEYGFLNSKLVAKVEKK